MSSVMTAGPPAVVAVAGGGVQAFQGGLADGFAFGLGHRGEEREQHPARSVRVVDARWPGEHFQDQAVGGEVVGQGGEFGGVAAEAFHLIDGEDDAAGAKTAQVGDLHIERVLKHRSLIGASDRRRRPQMLGGGDPGPPRPARRRGKAPPVSPRCPSLPSLPRLSLARRTRPPTTHTPQKCPAF